MGTEIDGIELDEAYYWDLPLFYIIKQVNEYH
jgi:hypothetical protein